MSYDLISNNLISYMALISRVIQDFKALHYGVLAAMLVDTVVNRVTRNVFNGMKTPEKDSSYCKKTRYQY